MVDHFYHQNVLYKKEILLKNKNQNGLLSSLGLKTPFNKIPLLGDIFF